MIPKDVYFLALNVREWRVKEATTFRRAKTMEPNSQEWREFKDEFDSARNARMLAEIALATRVLRICQLDDSVDAITVSWMEG